MIYRQPIETPEPVPEGALIFLSGIKCYMMEAKSHDQAFQRIVGLRLLSNDYSIMILSCECIDYFMPPTNFNASAHLAMGEHQTGAGYFTIVDMGYERVHGRPDSFLLKSGYFLRM